MPDRRIVDEILAEQIPVGGAAEARPRSPLEVIERRIEELVAQYRAEADDAIKKRIQEELRELEELRKAIERGTRKED